MSLTEEQIAKMMTKEIKAKTILVDADKVDDTIKEHEQDGWTLVSKTPLNDRFKLTFKKVK